ncbi:MAG: MFS transporter [Thermodesulfovibrionales bacterium]|nr:MFS transporter [Thermodesulfovibrionales bacterium]
MARYLEIFRSKKMVVMLFLGFSSGLPLALSGATLQAWLTVSGIDIKTIGLYSVIGIPYTIKFLWSPLMDRYIPPFFDRRRGWIAICQVLLALCIGILGFQEPANALLLVGLLALFLAFASASQDIVIDAYRTDILESQERGLGSAVFVLGYRIGMLVSGALALILSDRIGWNKTYFVMSTIMALTLLFTYLAPRPPKVTAPPRSIKEAVIGPLKDFFSKNLAVVFLLLIVLYKLGDAYLGTLTTAFLIRAVGFTPTDVGAINKGFGLVSVIIGSLIGGAMMVRVRLFHALLLFGILQAFSNLSFILLDIFGKDYALMVFVIAFENLAGGMGTSAFVALIMSLCNVRFSATQYALLSSLSSLGRVLIAPTSGFVVESIGWSGFFVMTFLISLPALFLILYMRQDIEKLVS